MGVRGAYSQRISRFGGGLLSECGKLTVLAGWIGASQMRVSLVHEVPLLNIKMTRPKTWNGMIDNVRMHHRTRRESYPMPHRKNVLRRNRMECKTCARSIHLVRNSQHPQARDLTGIYPFHI